MRPAAAGYERCTVECETRADGAFGRCCIGDRCGANDCGEHNGYKEGEEVHVAEKVFGGLPDGLVFAGGEAVLYIPDLLGIET